MRTQSRPNGAWETTRKRGAWRRLTLRRSDGQVYLDRWGISLDRIGGVMLHRMEAPDPGIDLHDHPWWFVSIILWGGYTEARAGVRTPDEQEWIARRPLSVRSMRLDECHTITDLARTTSWSLVIKGPRKRLWGFYVPGGWMPEAKYDATIRAGRRDLWSDQRVAERPWA